MRSARFTLSRACHTAGLPVGSVTLQVHLEPRSLQLPGQMHRSGPLCARPCALSRQRVRPGRVPLVALHLGPRGEGQELQEGARVRAAAEEPEGGAQAAQGVALPAPGRAGDGVKGRLDLHQVSQRHTATLMHSRRQEDQQFPQAVCCTPDHVT